MSMALQHRDQSPRKSFMNGSSANNRQSKTKTRSSDDDQLVEHIRRFSSLSQEEFLRMKDAEQQDDFFTLRNAQDIKNPDTESDTHSMLSVKLVPNSFRRVLGVKEICSKQGTFLHRTIELHHKPGESLGFLIRQGDGWSRRDGIFVSRLILGTDVDNFELLRVGDEIIRVNKVDVRAMSVNDVSALMQMAKRLIITVKVLTPLSKKKLLSLSNSTRTRFSSTSTNPKLSKDTQERFATSHTSVQYNNIPRIYSHRTNFKIASLPIGRNAIDNKIIQSPTLSRSRSYNGRNPTTGKRALSPIYETNDAQFEPNGILTTGRRKSISGGSNSVSWYDQVSANTTDKTNKTAKSWR